MFFLASIPVHLFSQAPGCPDIQVDDEIIDCNTSCVDLVAIYPQTGETTTYDVDAISYSPPSSFNVGTSTIVGTDDIWGNTITLPFNFCFFASGRIIIKYKTANMPPSIKKKLMPPPFFCSLRLSSGKLSKKPSMPYIIGSCSISFCLCFGGGL